MKRAVILPLLGLLFATSFAQGQQNQPQQQPPAPNQPQNPPPGNQNALQWLSWSPVHTIFYGIIRQAGLTGLFANERGISVYAPTNAGMLTTLRDLRYRGPTDKVPVGRFWNTLLHNRASNVEIQQFVRYHIGRDRLTAEQIAGKTDGRFADRFVMTYANLRIELKEKGGQKTLQDNAKKIPNPKLSTSNAVSNGIIHSIDRVLIPINVNRERLSADVVQLQRGTQSPNNGPTTTTTPGPTTRPTTAPVAGNVGSNNNSSGDPSSSPLSEQSPQPGNPEPGSVCFPGAATVETRDGIKPMSDVKTGDSVKVSGGSFSDIFMFTHKMADAKHDFVVVKTANAEIALTAGHYLYVNGNLAAASTVRVGDVIESASGSPMTVASVGSARMFGLYNPQTVHGDIIVNGIRASTFTTAVQPGAAQALLTPLRAVYAKLGFTTAFLNQGSDFLANRMPSGTTQRA